MKNNKVTLIIVIFAVVLRIFLLFFSYHPDIQNFQLVDQIVAKGNVINLYDYPFDPSSDSVLSKTDIIYPPLIYLYRGVFATITSHSPGLGFNDDYNMVEPTTFGDPLFNIHLFLIKLPLVIFDLLVLVFIIKLFKSSRERYLALILWLFNPVNLYTTYMMGQFDVIAVFFTVLALYFASNNKLGRSSLSLGFGAAFKIYPIFLIIPLMTKGKNLSERFRILILGLLPYVASMLLYLPSEGYRKTAMVAGQTLKSLYAQIPVSGGESILLFPLFLGLFYIIFYYHKDRGYDLWKSSFLTLILFYIFTHFHSQWFLWITPFLIIELIRNNFKHWLVTSLVLICFTLQLFFFDPSLTIHMFAPLWPGLILQPSLWEILGLKLDYNMSRSMIQTGLVATLMFYIYRYFPKRSDV